MQSTRNLTKGMPARMIILAMVVMICFLACEGEKKPAVVLDEKKFSALLVDVYLAESKLAVMRVNQDSAMRLFEPFETQLLEKRNISRSALKETYRYYMAHPGAFEKIYENVMDTLSLREQRAQAAKKVIDSVTNAEKVRHPAKPDGKGDEASAGKSSDKKEKPSSARPTKKSKALKKMKDKVAP